MGRRFPNPALDARTVKSSPQLFELDDFGPSEAVERFPQAGRGMKPMKKFDSMAAY